MNAAGAMKANGAHRKPGGKGEGKTVVVIGGGFGGMAAALRLRAQGYQVSVVERQARLGGRAQVFERDGYRHDAGPTVITAPFLFAELFELFGKRMDDYVRIVPLDPWYRFWFPDGDTFDYGGTLDQTLGEVRRISPADEQGYLKLLDHSRKLFDVGFTRLADRPFDRPWMMAGQIPNLVRLRADRSVWQLVAKYLKHPKLREVFSVQPLLVGGNPFETTSIYGLIHYLEHKWGVHFVMGGTGRLVDALWQLMIEEGIEVRTGETVDHVEIGEQTARGVVLGSGDVMVADIVVSNADPLHLYGHMIAPETRRLPVRLKLRSRKSMGLYVLYFGTERTYPNVAHHTIWLGPRYKELLDEIFRQKIMTEDFSLYVHRPTATDPSFAPPGHESFYVLCPVANLDGELNWSVEGPRLKERIVEALEKTMLPGLGAAMRSAFYMTPDDFQERYLSVAGAGFSIAPNLTQSAWFRFHNRGEGIRNLYLVGAGTHPGAGLPGVLSSAKVVERLISEA